MFTFLDLFIVVAMTLIAGGMLALALMFLLRNKTAKRVCFYLVAALGLYLGYVGFRINWLGFTSQVVFAGVMALISIGSVVVERLYKNQEKQFNIARALASVALVGGLLNAFFI